MNNGTQNPFFTMFPSMDQMFVPDFEGFRQRMAAMPQVMQTAQNVRVGATPCDVIYREDKMKVLHYRSDVPKKHATPLLLVFALVNRPYILDLLPHKSVVRRFLDAGFDVFKIDWGIPTDTDRYNTLEYYVEGLLHHAVAEVQALTGQPKVSLLGYCMGGTMSAMYTSLHQDEVKNFILMAAPIDWSDKTSLLSVWSDEKWFDVDQVVDTFGNAPPQWLQGSFALLKPVSNMIEKYIGFYERMTDQKFVEEFVAMETWVNDNIPVPGETFRQFVKDCFQQNKLIRGEMRVGRKPIDFGQITCPILNLMASGDHLVPCGQSAPFNDAVGSRDRKAITFPAGHIGLSVGSKAHKELWPKVAEWLAERSDPLK